jgi:hypothetical protein
MAFHDFASMNDFYRGAIRYDFSRFIGEISFLKIKIEGKSVLAMTRKGVTLIAYKLVDGAFTVNFIIKGGILGAIFEGITEPHYLMEFSERLVEIYKQSRCPISHNPVEHGFLIEDCEIETEFKVSMVKVRDHIQLSA